MKPSRGQGAAKVTIADIIPRTLWLLGWRNPHLGRLLAPILSFLDFVDDSAVCVSLVDGSVPPVFNHRCMHYRT